MMEKPYEITQLQLEQIQQKLKEHKHTLESEIPQMLAEALGLGDAANNAEYEFAMGVKSRCEAQIAELEQILGNYVLVSDEA